MKVAASARPNVRKALNNHDVNIDLSDSAADALVRAVRKTLSSKVPAELPGQAQLMVKALNHVRYCTHSHVTPELDADEWSTLLWDVYTASVNNTKSAAACEALVESSEAWADTIVLLMNEPLDVEYSLLQPWYCTRRVTSLWLLLASMGLWMLSWGYESAVAAFLALTSDEVSQPARASGRLKTLCVFGGFMLAVASVL